MGIDREEYGAAFAKWWSAAGPLLSDRDKEFIARTAWNAGVRAAVLILDREVHTQVQAACYGEAATVRDCRENCEHLFTLRGLWHRSVFEKRLNAETPDELRKRLRELATNRLVAELKDLTLEQLEQYQLLAGLFDPAVSKAIKLLTERQAK